MNTKIFAPKSILWWILTTGMIGLFGASMLTYEHIHLLLHPNAVLSCDANALIACSKVMEQPQAQLFGFPNSWIGVVGFTLVVAFAAAQLFFSKTYARQTWVAFVAGIGFAVTFVSFLFSQSMFVIHVLCPYCMVVWAGTIPLFIHLVLWARANEIFDLKAASLEKAKSIFEWSWVIAIGFEIAVFAWIFVSFQDAIKSLWS